MIIINNPDRWVEQSTCACCQPFLSWLWSIKWLYQKRVTKDVFKTKDDCLVFLYIQASIHTRLSSNKLEFFLVVVALPFCPMFLLSACSCYCTRTLRSNILNKQHETFWGDLNFSFILILQHRHHSWYPGLSWIVPLGILFSSNHNIHKNSFVLCFWASDPLIDRFY